MGAYLGRSTNLIFAFLTLVTLVTTAAPPETSQSLDDFWSHLETKLNERHNGANNHIVLRVQPAYITAIEKSREKQILDADQRLIDEAKSVYESFAAASDHDKKHEVEKRLKEFDRYDMKPGSTIRVFRRAFIIDAEQVAGENSIQQVMEQIAAFETHPKPGDIYYRYSNSRSLVLSRIEETRGSDKSYLFPSLPPMSEGIPVVIKKCRRLDATWKCNTNILEVTSLQSRSNDKQKMAMVLVESLVSMSRNGDAPIFLGVGRSRNTAYGLTGAVLVIQHGHHILIYNATLDVPILDASDRGASSNKLNEYDMMLNLLRRAFGENAIL